MNTEAPVDFSPSRPRAVSSPSGRLWAVVLAGGEGVRLRPLTKQVSGDERPKQYVALLGSRSLLRHTLDRVILTIPPERTVVVSQERHADYLTAEFQRRSAPWILPQPDNRGTAAGVLYPAHWIHWRDREATVAVFPSDHFIPDGHAFMAHVRGIAGFVDRHPDWLVLLGARPTEPETEYGWIEPGASIGRLAAGPVYRVRRFWEKPSPELASTAFSVGCLWNTFVFIAKARTLLAEGRRALPQLTDRLSHMVPFLGTEHEAWAVRQAYALAPTANFSRAILETSARLAVSRLPGLTWSDWGTPRRVLQSLERAGLAPQWLEDLGQSVPDGGRVAARSLSAL
jgi:mannose-1-phosphate guanylyltransferase